MLNKIRSKYVLKNIASYINPRIYLLLYKYNKKLQKKLELSKKDFRAYNQIEIEITPKDVINDGKNTITLNIKLIFIKKYLIYFIN